MKTADFIYSFVLHRLQIPNFLKKHKTVKHIIRVEKEYKSMKQRSRKINSMETVQMTLFSLFIQMV